VLEVIAVPSYRLYGEYMGIVVKVLRKRQITLPKEICDALGIEEGDLLLLEVENGRIVARKLDPIDVLEGFLAPEKPVKGLAEAIDDDRKRSER